MNILFDTNIILDVLLERGDFFEDAATLVNRVELAEINGFLSANSIATIYYIIKKAFDNQKAVKQIELLSEIFDIAPVNKTVIINALKLEFKDFEDAIIHESARAVNADIIVTRNLKDYTKAEITINSPTDLLKALPDSSSG